MTGREVDAGPFREWLGVRLTAMGVWDPVNQKSVPAKHLEGARSMAEIGQDWGLSARTLMRILKGEQLVVGEEKMDRVFCRAGEPYLMSELYPSEVA